MATVQVEKIKAKKGIGIKYMKSWERECELREEGIEIGREEERKNTEAELAKLVPSFHRS